MTAREKIAFQNLRISLLEECIECVRTIAVKEPRTLGSNPKGVKYHLILELIEDLQERIEECQGKISQIREIENDLAA